MNLVFISAGGYIDKEDYAKGNLLGTEYQIFELSKELVRRGHEVSILRRWHNSTTENVDNIKIFNLESSNNERPGLKLTFSKLKLSKFAAELIKKNHPDIIVVVDPFTSYFTFKLPIPKILITHSQIPYALLPPEVLINNNVVLLKIKKIIQEILFNNVDIIIAINKSIKNYLENNGYKTTFIPNGINIEKYIPNYSDERYILFGGRLVKEKGVDYLIKAYSILDEKLQDEYQLQIVGFGPEKNYLEKLATKLGIKDNVEFVPWLCSEEFIKKISNCSVFVLPSLYETFGVVGIEAMALGKPLIASNIAGPQDIITHGYDGILFEKGNVYKLKEHIEHLLYDCKLRKDIGRNARKTIEKKYDFKIIANKYLDVFNSLIK